MGLEFHFLYKNNDAYGVHGWMCLSREGKTKIAWSQ